MTTNLQLEAYAKRALDIKEPTGTPDIAIPKLRVRPTSTSTQGEFEYQMGMKGWQRGALAIAQDGTRYLNDDVQALFLEYLRND